MLKKNELVIYDWTQGPQCMVQQRSEFRARRLKRIRSRNKRMAMAARLGMILRLPEPEDIIENAEELALFGAVFFAPLILMGILFGPVIP